MEALSKKVLARGKALFHKVVPPAAPQQPGPKVRQAVQRVSALSSEVAQLRERVAELEAEVQETRRLHQRVAELTDVVAEVLVPAADRQDEQLRKALSDYSKSTF